MIENESLQGFVPYTVELGTSGLGGSCYKQEGGGESPLTVNVTPQPFRAGKTRGRKPKGFIWPQNHQPKSRRRSRLSQGQGGAKTARKSTGKKVKTEDPGAPSTSTAMSTSLNDILESSFDELWYPCPQCHKKYKCRSSLDSHVSLPMSLYEPLSTFEGRRRRQAFILYLTSFRNILKNHAYFHKRPQPVPPLQATNRGRKSQGHKV